MPRKVLVIEDDTGARDALECLLAEEGYAVRTAASGNAGLSCAREFKPDVVLCDFYLPDIDGLQVMRRLRDDPDHAYIIMVTAGRYQGEQELALRTEADLFLDKPIDLERLRQALRAENGSVQANLGPDGPSTDRKPYA